MAAPALNGDSEMAALLAEMGGEVSPKATPTAPPPTPQHRRLTEFSDFSLDDSEFRLKASFEADRCPAYQTPDGEHAPNNSCCQHCGLVPALHTMKTKTSSFLAVLFCQTRNLRCIASEDLIDTPGVHVQRFADKMERLLQLDAERAVRHQQLTTVDLRLIQEKITALVERIRRPVPPPRSGSSNPNSQGSHRHDRLEWRMQVMIHADQLYYRIYYVALTALADQNYSATAATAAQQLLNIPPPSVYFHELTWNVHDGIHATRRWMNAYLNEQHRTLLTNTFGLAIVTLQDSTLQQQSQSQSQPNNNNNNNNNDDDIASICSSASNPLHWLWQLRFVESVRLLWATGYVADTSLESLATATERKEHLQAPFQIHETLATPLIQEWRDAARDFPASLYSYATPSPRALQVIREALVELEEEVRDANNNNNNSGIGGSAKDRPVTVVEMGAGTGYWSSVLKALAGVDVKPFDVAPPGTHSDNDYHGEVVPFCRMPQRDSSVMEPNTECLVLCYPPPGSDMAVSALHAFTGSTVLHVGEWAGLTGDIHFEQVLAETFSCVDHVPLPSWGTDAAYVTIWKRKAIVMGTNTNNNTTCASSAVIDLDPLEEGSPSMSPPETIKASRSAAVGGCIACEAHKAVRRCRYARHLQYCCVDCFEGHLQSRTYWMALQMLDTTEQDVDWDDPRHFTELKGGKHHKKRRKKRKRKS